MPSPQSPQDFVAKWRKTTLRERAAAQEHFIDLCRLVGHPTPAEADPVGKEFTFEAGVTKQTGGEGWADVWKKDHFAWEYKGKHKDLDEAYTQLLLYREFLLNPPLLVVSDMERILIHTNFNNTAKKIITISYDDLVTPSGFKQLAAAFFDPNSFRAPETTEQVTEEAAKDFARLADLLRASGADPQQAAHFLIRLLFCLFAEDIGLLPKKLFTQLVQNTFTEPLAFREQLGILFRAMASGQWFGSSKIRNFDGRLFDDDTTLELNNEGMDILLRACNLDWSNIEPSILGTLFERSLDPAKRSQIGAHYTSKEDILLVVEPVLMKPFRDKWEGVKQQALQLANQRDNAGSRSARTRYERELAGLLTGFALELGQVRILDPACGSGNFLYVALKQLLDLEKEVVTLASMLDIGRFFPSVSPVQLHGVEINQYAHELAQATIWIGYIQWLHDNGFGLPTEPILKPLETILHMDAILTLQDGILPSDPMWPEADIIIGNPPFLGSRKMHQGLGEQYCKALEKVYKGRINGRPDLVCYWFAKANELITQGKAKRVGLLATQAIRGGTNRRVLDRIRSQSNIFMAWTDREWILDGAKVHVSIIGFDDGGERHVTLDGQPVKQINPDLTTDVDVTTAHSLKENNGLCFEGEVLRGQFNIDSARAQAMLASMGNPNVRPNSDVVKPRRTGQDVVERASNSHVIDFGVNMTMEEASQYTVPFEYVKEKVYPFRQKARQRVAREKWWIHWNPRTQMRKALAGLPRYIATPRVAKHRLFVWLDREILPDAELVVFARADDYFLGVLHSKVHEIWARRKGTQLRDRASGFRYTPKTTFRTFPFPWPPGKEPKDSPLIQAVSDVAVDLITKRNAWLNPPDYPVNESNPRTLTNLYNNRPTWLSLAHNRLDEVVLDAYGWPHDLTDEEILQRLLALNHERARG